MIEVVVPATGQQVENAFAVRVAVFVDEQGIPRSEELDELDATAVACVAYADGVPIAAGRLLPGDGYAKIGRMAVLAEHRGRGIGGKVLEALEREGVARGIRCFKLSAQVTARAFYERHGYIALGDVYDEVDIPHIAMEKRL